MPRTSPLPPGALLSRADWIARGVSTHRLSGPDLTRIFPGVYTPTAQPASLTAMCHRLQRHVLPGCVISHSTAAALHGLPLPWWFDGGIGLLGESTRRTTQGRITPSRLPEASPDARRGEALHQPAASPRAASSSFEPTSAWTPPPLHCIVPPGGSHSGGPGVCVHRSHPGQTVSIEGLVVSHPVEVLRQLGTALPLDDLVAVADHLLGEASPVPDMPPVDMREILRREQRHGSPAARNALVLARPRVASPGETRLRLLITRAGFPEPTPDIVVPDPDAPGHVRRIDLGYAHLLIGIEYQGEYHRTGRDQWRADERRRDTLAAVGWDLRYATAADIARPQRFLSALPRRSRGTPCIELGWLGGSGARPQHGTTGACCASSASCAPMSACPEGRPLRTGAPSLTRVVSIPVYMRLSLYTGMDTNRVPLGAPRDHAPRDHAPRGRRAREPAPRDP